MKYPLYAYRDKLNGFGAPIMYSNDAAMKRKFAQDINNAPDLVFAPADYDLYKIGEFDSEKGTVKSILPDMICSGASVFNKKE